MRSRLLGFGVAVAVLFAMGSSDGTAQQVGTVTGQVVDQQSLQALPSMQISIAALGIGSLSQANGRYLLANVPVGTHTLTAQRIGYRTATQEIQVMGGQTVVADFQVSTEALSLAEVIVTGTPGGTQRRAIGNDVARVDVGSVVARTPPRDLQGLLKTQAPGLSILPSSGSVGSGGSIRIRGANSFTLSNEPIVYIDGVRMDATPYGGNRGRNPINEIDPETIASIEIIKGPAAATLYGTEASGGVIQILTKRGVTGTPTVDVSVQMGTHWLPNPGEKSGTSYYRDAAGALVGFDLYDNEATLGKGPIFQNGLLQSYNASITGGSDAIRYFASLGADDNMGIIARDYQWQTAYNGRLNLGATLSESLELDFSLGVVRNNIKEIASSVEQHFTSLVWAQPTLADGPSRGFHAAPPEAMELIDVRQQIDRTTGSFQLTHSPLDWLTQRLVVGVDNRNSYDSRLYPRQPPDGINGDGARFHGSRRDGQKDVTTILNQLVTADYAATGSFDVTGSINTQTSIGFQYYQKKVQTRGALGIVFPTPVVTTISGAATTLVARTSSRT